MGERHSGGAAPGRPHAHPDGTDPGRLPAPGAVLGDDALEALLSAAVLRGHRPDTESERRAVAAFRAARDAGAHRARTRRRDDWRARERRTRAPSVRTTLSLFLASLTLGGVAVAAIGSSGPSDAPAQDGTRTTPASDAPGGPADPPAARPARPSTAQDAEAKCRAWDRVERRGGAAGSTAWQRLVTAAGGADEVAAYCAGQPAKARGGAQRKGEGNGSGRTDGPAAENGTAENGTAGNGTAGIGTAGIGTGGESAAGADRGGGKASGRGAGKKD